jgi:predicted nucleic acid-binding protein
MESLKSGLSFCCTAYVNYECLYKIRKRETENDNNLKERFKREKEKGQFQSCPISIADLQTIEILEKRQNLGKGELSSIVFAKKINQAFITDDKRARILSEFYIDRSSTQTVTQLLGWLVFNNKITDSDKDTIIKEHTNMGRPLKKYFEKIYLQALEERLKQTTSSTINRTDING